MKWPAVLRASDDNTVFVDDADGALKDILHLMYDILEYAVRHKNSFFRFGLCHRYKKPREVSLGLCDLGYGVDICNINKLFCSYCTIF